MGDADEIKIFENKLGIVYDSFCIMCLENKKEELSFKEITSITIQRKRNYILAFIYFLLALIFLNGAVGDWKKGSHLISVSVYILSIIMFLAFLSYLLGNLYIKILKPNKQEIKLKIKQYENKIANEFVVAIQKKLSVK